MVAAFIGIFIMIKGGIESGDYFGNILALGCSFCFSIYILLIRKFRDIDMTPASLIGGIFIVIVSFIVNKGDINVPVEDIFLCILWGAILNGFMHIVFNRKFFVHSFMNSFIVCDFPVEITQSSATLC